MTETRRVFIGGVGYTNLRDLSVGPAVVQELRRLAWPDGVEIDDLSPGGPIAAVHRFRELPPYDRVVLVAAVDRGRQPGRIYWYRWDGILPDRDEIQQRVAEGVTGVISLDNLLIVGGYFAIWPPDVILVEVEPVDEDWGPDFSEPVKTAIYALMSIVRRAALAPLVGLATDPATAWEEMPETEHADALYDGTEA